LSLNFTVSPSVYFTHSPYRSFPGISCAENLHGSSLLSLCSEAKPDDFACYIDSIKFI
jgi:hypothetical protein